MFMNSFSGRFMRGLLLGVGTLSKSYCSSGEESKNGRNSEIPAAQPSFQAVINIPQQLKKYKRPKVTLQSLVILSGTAHRSLSEEIAKLIGVELGAASIGRFADGEVSVKIDDPLAGKDVFIVQTCASGVNDSIIELLLTISTAKRSGADRVTAVIPYFGYKHHRRGMSTSTKHQSKFLSSGAMDFAKMLSEMGVDRVIAVDIQRPGQGHEACFFDNNIPLEAIVTTDFLIDEVVKSIKFENPILVVAPNSECVKKTRKFQVGLKKRLGVDVRLAAFFHTETGSGPTDVERLELLVGNGKASHMS